jgi:hypothetical protein
MSISGITLDSSSTIKAICQEYNEPSTSTVNVFKLNQDGTGTSCKYSKSAIKINSWTTNGIEEQRKMKID